MISSDIEYDREKCLTTLLGGLYVAVWFLEYLFLSVFYFSSDLKELFEASAQLSAIYSWFSIHESSSGSSKALSNTEFSVSL